MSIIIGNGFILDELTADVTCPICTSDFNADKWAEKGPCVNIKCPKCKGKITILFPIFGGNLKCWETNVPKCIEPIQTETEPKITIIS